MIILRAISEVFIWLLSLAFFGAVLYAIGRGSAMIVDWAEKRRMRRQHIKDIHEIGRIARDAAIMKAFSREDIEETMAKYDVECDVRPTAGKGGDDD